MSDKKNTTKKLKIKPKAKKPSTTRLIFEPLEKRILLSADIGVALPEIEQEFLLDTDIAPPTEPQHNLLIETKPTEPAEISIIGLSSDDKVEASDIETAPLVETTETQEQAQAELIYAAQHYYNQEVKEVVFVDSTIDGYEELIESLFTKEQLEPDVLLSNESESVELELNSEAQQVKEQNEDNEPSTKSLFVLAEETSKKLRPDIDIYLLNPETDGVEQISQVLENYQGLAAVHLISHGSTGILRIGNSQLSTATISKHSEKIKSWRQALTHSADIMLYGCNVADGKAGVDFVKDLSYLTGADIAASNDATGGNAVGGDWQLEYSTGVIETEIVSASEYGFLLETITGTSAADVLDGTNSNDIIQGLGKNDQINGLGGSDTLEGGSGDDTYKFANDWGADDTVTDTSGKDTLDFRAVTKDISISIVAGKLTITQAGNKVTVNTNSEIEHIILNNAKDNTIDLSGLTDVNKAATFKLVGVNKVELSYDSINVTIDKVHNLKGGSGDDIFIINSGTLKGTIDGGLGNNTLSYIDDVTKPDSSNGYKNPIDLDLAKKKAIFVNGGADNGFNRIQKVFASKNDDQPLIASAGFELHGAKGDDIIQGSDVADTKLYGDAGNDTLDGKLGNDDLFGGKGKDTYVFNANWGQDTVHENQQEGADTLDLTAINASITFEVKDSATTGIKVVSDVNEINNAKYIERILLASTDKTYDFTFHNDWAKDLEGSFAKRTLAIESVDVNNDPVAFADSTNVTLDFSNVTVDLLFLIDKEGLLKVQEQRTEDSTSDQYSELLIRAENISSIIGGKGNNTYQIQDGGTLKGKITGGSGTQPNGKINTLDYSQYQGDAGIELKKVDAFDTNKANGVFSGVAGGYKGINRIIGSDTDDTMVVSDFPEGVLLDGGKGNDRLDGKDNSTDLLHGGANNDVLFGDGGSDTLYGDSGNDILYGGDNAVGLTTEKLYGGSGDDVLFGEGGNDTLFGGAGNDLLIGGLDNDAMRGGTGNDVYQFTDGWGEDTVFESKRGGEDTLDFSQVTGALTHVLDKGELTTGTANYQNYTPPTDGFTDYAKGTVSGEFAAGGNLLTAAKAQNLNEIQQIVLGNATSGKFQLTVLLNSVSYTTDDITLSNVAKTTASNIESALNTKLGTNGKVDVSVATDRQNAWDIEFIEPALVNVDQLTINKGTLNNDAFIPYVRTKVDGRAIQEQQELVITGVTSGTFTIEIEGKKTADITLSDDNTTATAIKTELEKLQYGSGLLGKFKKFDVEVNVKGDKDWIINFLKPSDRDVGEIIVNATGLGNTANVEVKTLREGLAPSGLEHIEKIVASGADNTFIFGNDWGLQKFFTHEPDYVTAWNNTSRKIELDTSMMLDKTKNDVSLIALENALDPNGDYKSLDYGFDIESYDAGHDTLTLTYDLRTHIANGANITLFAKDPSKDNNGGTYKVEKIDFSEVALPSNSNNASETAKFTTLTVEQALAHENTDLQLRISQNINTVSVVQDLLAKQDTITFIFENDIDPANIFRVGEELTIGTKILKLKALDTYDAATKTVTLTIAGNVSATDKTAIEAATSVVKEVAVSSFDRGNDSFVVDGDQSSFFLANRVLGFSELAGGQFIVAKEATVANGKTTVTVSQAIEQDITANTGQATLSFDVVAVNAGNDTLTLAGNQLANYSRGDSFVIAVGANKGLYTIDLLALNGPNTDITVKQGFVTDTVAGSKIALADAVSKINHTAQQFEIKGNQVTRFAVGKTFNYLDNENSADASNGQYKVGEVVYKADLDITQVTLDTEAGAGFKKTLSKDKTPSGVLYLSDELNAISAIENGNDTLRIKGDISAAIQTLITESGAADLLLPVKDSSGVDIAGLKVNKAETPSYIAQNDLVLDFRNVSQELSFKFGTDAEGNQTLSVSRLASPALLKNVARFGQVTDLMTSLLFPNKNFATITITNINEHTVIYGGGDKSTFSIKEGTQFAGTVVGSQGLRNPLEVVAEALSLPHDTAALILPSATVINTVDFSQNINPKDPKSYANLIGAAATYINLGNSVVAGLGNGPTYSSIRVAGKTGFTGTVTNMTSATYGSGANIILGSGVGGFGSGGADIAKGIFGNILFGRNHFSNAGKLDLSINTDELGSKTAIAAQAFNNLIAGRMPTWSPGIHLLSGKAGADTYNFSGIWGVAAVLEVPDISVGGVALPEGYDTLNFSGVPTDLHFTVIEITTENIDELKGSFPGSSDRHLLGVGSNVVIVSDGLFDQGSSSLPLTPFADGVNFVIANDIENIIGGSATNTISFIGGAELQGTVTSSSGGSIVLDYSHWNDFKGLGKPFDHDTGVETDLGRWDQELIAPRTFAGGTFSIPKLSFEFGTASGIQGNRLAGIDEIIKAFGIDMPTDNLAVNNVSKIIAGSGDDILKGNNARDNTFVLGKGGSDDIDGIGFAKDGNTISYEGVTTAVTIDLLNNTASHDGKTATLANIQNLAGGEGNDSLIGNSEKNIFFFSDDWGTDTVDTGGGQDILNFSAVSSKVTYSIDSIGRGVYTSATGDTVTVTGAYDLAETEKTLDPAKTDSSWTKLISPLPLPFLLQAAEAEIAVLDANNVNSEQLELIAKEAINRWLSVISDEQDQQQLEGYTFTVAELPATVLGSAGENLITVDSDAGGIGWFIDTTPKDNTEFTQTADGVLLAKAGTDADGRVDLLTVVMHELGHLLGLQHTADGSLLGTSLESGLRLIPTITDGLAVGGPAVNGALLTLAEDEQTVINEGFAALDDWAAGFNNELVAQFGPEIPFTGQTLADLFGINAIDIQTKVNELATSLDNLFDSDVTEEQLLAQGISIIDENQRQFKASIELIAPIDKTLNIDVSQISMPKDFLGLDLDFSLFGLSGDIPAFDLTGGIQFDFDFGLDSGGEFYVANAGARADIAFGDEPASILAVNQGGHSVTVDGNQGAKFIAGELLEIIGSTDNDGGFIIDKVHWDSANNITEITVVNAISNINSAVFGDAINEGGEVFSITAMQSTGDSIDVKGDLVADNTYAVGDSFMLSGSTGNDGQYTILDIQVVNDISTVYVDQDLTFYQTDGYIRSTFDAVINLGPLAIELNNAVLGFNAGVFVGTEQQLSTADLLDLGTNAVSNLDLLSGLSENSGFDVFLPLQVATPLSGLEIAPIILNASSSIGLPTAQGLPQMMSQLAYLFPSSMGLNDLIKFNGFSLDDILNIIDYSLDELAGQPLDDADTAADEQGLIYKEMALVDKSAAQILATDLNTTVGINKLTISYNDGADKTAEGFNIFHNGSSGSFDLKTAIQMATIQFDSSATELEASLQAVWSDAKVVGGVGSRTDPWQVIFESNSVTNLTSDDAELSTDFITLLRDAFKEVRAAVTDLSGFETEINKKLKGMLGFDSTHEDLVILEYVDSSFLFDMSFESSLDTQLDLSVDLGDFLDEYNSLPLDIDVSSEAKLGVHAGLAFDLGIEFDLSDVSDPTVYFDDTTGLAFDLDINSLNGLAFTTAIGIENPFDSNENIEVGLFAKEGYGSLSLEARAGLSDDSDDDGRYTFSEFGDNFGFTANGFGELVLPLYFPIESLPLGGFDGDFNNDGISDNALYLNLDVSENGIDNFEYYLPPLLPSFDLFAILNDPGRVLNSLELMFDGLKTGMESKFAELTLPFIADELKEAADFIDDLRIKLLGINDVNAAVLSVDRYGASGLGFELFTASENGTPTSELIVDLIKNAVYDTLGNLVSIPVLDINGNPIFNEITGQFETVNITGPEDVEVIFEGDRIQFNLLIADEVFPELNIGLDFGASLPGFELNSDTGINVNLDYIFGLGFGFGRGGFYVDTSGVTESGSELGLSLSAELASGSTIDAELAFLQASLAEQADDDGNSGLFGSFEIDLQDRDRDGQWFILGSEQLDIIARLNAYANLDVAAAVSMSDIDLSVLGLGDAVLELPKLTSTIHFDQNFADAEFGSNGTNAQFGGTPELWFEDVSVDAGGFISGFVAPIMDPILKVIGPIMPLIDMLTKEIGFLKEVNAPFTSLRDIIALVKGEKSVAAIDAIQSLGGLAEQAKTFGDSGSLNFGDFFISFAAGGVTTPTQNEARSNSTKSTTSTNNTSASNTTANSNASANEKINQFKQKGSFELTILENPTTAVGLLLGKDVDIFKYNLPAFDVTLEFGKSIPVFPGLNARFGGGVEFKTDFDFGFDTSGFNAFQASDWSDPLLLFNGFYMDDHIEGDIDIAEASLGATIKAGVSLGIGGIVEAGVEGGIRSEVSFDFNDFDNNGKFYADEMLKRLDQDILCLFDIDGAVSAFLDAFLWVGLELGITEVTLYEYRQSFINEVLADFSHHCPPPATPDIASVTGTELTLRYDGEGSSNNHDYSVEFVEELNLKTLYDYAGDSTDHDGKDNVNKELLKDKNGRGLTDADGALKNQILIKSRGVVEVFDADKITAIRAVGTNEGDKYRISDEVFANSGITTVNIQSRGGNDIISLGGKDGTIVGKLTNSHIDGGAGNDKLIGSAYSDTIIGGTGNDQILAYAGDDIVYSANIASESNAETDNDRNFDVVEGGAGIDTITGGDGDDRLFGDFIEEDVKYAAISAGDTIRGGSGKDYLFGAAGDDHLFGDAGDDIIIAGSGKDRLEGGLDNDRLEGGSGRDILKGDKGRDYLVGGTDEDDVDGGEGKDAIVWVDGDGDEVAVKGGLGEDSFIISAVGNTSDSVNVSALGLDAQVDFNSQLFDLNSFEVIDLNVGLGSDTIRVDDLTSSTVREFKLAFGQGEIKETVPIIRLVGIDIKDSQLILDDSIPVMDGIKQQVFFANEPYTNGQLLQTSFFRYNKDNPEYLVDGDGAPVFQDVDFNGNTIQVQSITGGLPTDLSLENLEQVETRSHPPRHHIYLASDVVEGNQEDLQTFNQIDRNGLVYLFDDNGTPLLQTLTLDDGNDYKIHDVEGGLASLNLTAAEMIAVETRAQISFYAGEKELKRIFSVEDELGRDQATLQRFYQLDANKFNDYSEADLDYLFDANGDPVLETVTVEGKDYQIQSIEGGLPTITQFIQLKAVETRQIERSQLVLGQAYDPVTGEAIEGESDYFINPVFGLDNGKDQLFIKGSTGDDQFDLSTETDEIRDESVIKITQKNGVDFTVSQGKQGQDEITISTGAGEDKIDASQMSVDMLKQLNVNAGENNDIVIGSPFIDVLNSGSGNDKVTGGASVDTFIDESGIDTLIESRNEYGYRDISLFNDRLVVGTLVESSTDVFDKYGAGAEVESLLQGVVPIFEKAVISGGENNNTLVVGDDDGFIIVGNDTLAIDNWGGIATLDNLNDDGSANAERYVVFMDGNGGMDVTIKDSGGEQGKDELLVYGSDQVEVYTLEVLNSGQSNEDARIRANKNGREDLIHYDTSLDNLVIKTLGENDQIKLDDTRVLTEVYAGSGRDNIIVGTVGERIDSRGIPVVDMDKLTAGVSTVTNIFGGTGNDNFEINHNLAELWLYGNSGDDVFVLNTFLVEKDPATSLDIQHKLGLVGGEGQNSYDLKKDAQVDLKSFYEYLENANVIIDGGPGTDTVVINGTAIGDLFVVTENFVAGAGRFVTFENIERLEVNGAGRDDDIYVLSTAEGLETIIRGGSGEDNIHMGGGAPEVFFDPPEFLFKPDAVLLQDIQKIYANQRIAAVAKGPVSYNEWVGVTRTRVEDNTAYYSYNSYPGYGSNLKKVKSSEDWNLLFFENVSNYFNPFSSFSANERHIQTVDAVSGYQGYTYKVAGDAAEDRVINGIRITELNSSFAKWDSKAWNKHTQALISSAVFYDRPAFNYIENNQFFYQQATTRSLDPFWLNPKSYYVKENRSDDMTAFKGQLIIDGGETFDDSGNVEQDHFVAHNENGSVTEGALDAVHFIQQKDDTGRALFEAGTAEASDEQGGFDLTVIGDVEEGKEWSVRIDGVSFSYTSIKDDDGNKVIDALRSKIHKHDDFTTSIRTESSERLLNVQRTNGNDISVVRFSTTATESREELVEKVMGDAALKTDDIVIESKTALIGFGQFGTEIENIEQMDLRLSDKVDTLTIDSSISGHTEVVLGGQDDIVNILATGGDVTILGGAGDDLVNVGDLTHTTENIKGDLVFKGDAHRYETSVGNGTQLDVVTIEVDGKQRKVDVAVTQANLNKHFENAPAIVDSNYFFSNAAVFDGASGTEELDENGDIKEISGKIQYINGQTTLQHGNQLDLNGNKLTAITTSNGFGNVTVFRNKPGIKDFQVTVDVRDTRKVEAQDVTVHYQEQVSVGAGNNDRLLINNRSAKSGQTGELTASQISGLGMQSGINYSAIEELVIDLGDMADIFNIASTSMKTTINSYAGNDQFTVSSDGATLLGDLAGINAELILDAGEDENSLIISDVADNTANVGRMTSSQLTGFSNGAINYVATAGNFLGGVDIRLGSGGNDISVESIAVNAPTTLHSGTGKDQITVEDNAGTLHAFDSSLIVDGQAGINTLTISDAADNSNNINGVLTENSLTGLGMVGIAYQNISLLDIMLGGGNDVFHVINTHQQRTKLNTAAGTAEINIDSVSGLTTIIAGKEVDTFNVGLTTAIESAFSGVLNLEGGESGDQYNVNIASKGNSLINILENGVKGSDELNITGTNNTDHFLLRREFVALLNADDKVERINYTNTIETLKIDSLDGDDYFTVDDNSALTEVNTGKGKDSVQVGQLFNEARKPDHVATEDEFETIETTKGLLSRGISYETTINGGDDEDTFLVLHNKERLKLNGEGGADSFTVRAFALASTGKYVQDFTDIAGGDETDYIEYAQNAPVVIDGGEGNDRVVILGTEESDNFVLTDTGIFGAGTNISYKNIEVIDIDGMEGDDHFYVQSTNPAFVTQLFGGLGSDSFHLSADVPAYLRVLDDKGESMIFADIQQNLDSIKGPLLIQGGLDLLADRSLPNAIMLPTETDADEFDIAPNPNLFVNEEEQDDVINFHNSQSSRNDKGVLTKDRLYGLGMGDDLVFPDGVTYKGGVSYSAVEILNVELGGGDDTLRVESTHAGETNVLLGLGNNILNLQSVSGVTRVTGGEDNDVFNLGSQAPALGNGVVNGIAADVTILGGAGFNGLNIDDAAENRDVSFDLRASTFDHQYMEGTVNYQSINEVDITAGSGHDQINVKGTSSKTRINSAAGNDTFNLSSDGETLAGSLTDLAGELLIEAGNGKNTLNVSDFANQVGLVGATLTQDKMTGFPADIKYQSTGGQFSGGINLRFGQGADFLTINSTLKTAVTSLWMNKGNDNVVFDGDDQNGQSIVFGESGDDSLTSKAWGNKQILFGDSGEVAFQGTFIGYQSSLITDKKVENITEIFSIADQEWGNDTVVTGQVGNIVIGGEGNDSITAADADDILLGDNGELLYQEGILIQARSQQAQDAGNDKITAGNGRNRVIAGVGDDQVVTGKETGYVIADNGEMLFDELGRPELISNVDSDDKGLNNDTIELGDGDNVALGGDGDDHITATNGNNIIIADKGSVRFVNGLPVEIEATLSQGGNDVVDILGAGENLIMGGGGDDQLNGGSGKDILLGDYGIATKQGTEFSKVVTTQPRFGGNDRLFGRGANDVLIGGAGDDYLSGDEGSDVLLGDGDSVDFYRNEPFSFESSDTKNGGVDTLIGGSGIDFMFGGFGRDIVHGNLTDDVFVGDYASFKSDAKGGNIELILGPDSQDIASSILVNFYNTSFFSAIPVGRPALDSAAEQRENDVATAPKESNFNINDHSGHQVGDTTGIDWINELPPTSAGNKVHDIVSGDTLWDIAAKYLGDAERWPELLELNLWLEGPDDLIPGQVIKLPEPANDDVAEENSDKKINDNLSSAEDVAIAAVAGYGSYRAKNTNGLFVFDDNNNRLKPRYRKFGKAGNTVDDSNIDWDHKKKTK